MAPTATATDAAAPATVTAEQLLLALLELIRTTQSAHELTLERVSAAMQQPAQTFGAGHFGYGGTLTPDWGYGLEVSKAGTPGTRLDLNFIDTTPGKNASATALCTVDFERFSAELQKAGFRGEVIRGEHGRVIYHRFDRPHLSIKVDTVPEDNTASGAAAHACVRLVTVQ